MIDPIDAGYTERTQFVKAWQPGMVARAHNSMLSTDARLLAAAEGYMAQSQSVGAVATFKRGELARLLGVGGQQVRRLIATLIEAGELDARSWSEALYLPPTRVMYGGSRVVTVIHTKPTGNVGINGA